MQPRPALILTLLAIACSGCACLPSTPGAESVRAGKLVSNRMERPGDAIVIDWSRDTLQSVTLDSNRALTFTGGQPGSRYTLSVTQDATGSRLVAWPADVRWPGGVMPPTLTTTAGKTDYVNFIYNGASHTYDGLGFVQNF